jgi:hypothetical protein
MNPYAPPAAELELPRPAAPVAHEPFTSVFGLFGRAVRVYFGNLGIIAPITLAVFGPVELVKNFLVHGASLEPTVAMRVEMAVENVFGALVSAALITALVEKLEHGRSMGVGEALSAGVKRWGAVFGARFLAGFYILFGLILLVVPGVVLSVRYALTDEVATLEPSRAASRTLARSKEVAHGRGLRLFAVGLLAMLPLILLQVAGGALGELAGHWALTAAIDCVNDLLYRFLVVVTLLAYLGSGGREGLGAPAEA